MMSSGSSTDRGAGRSDSGFQPWHFYLLLSLAGATWAVIVARDTHPAALVLLSSAIVAAGLVGAALHQAVTSLFGVHQVEKAAPSGRTREFLEQEKALVLRSIKELEFDRAMRKVGDQDFAEISSRLRDRAMEVMEQLEGAGADARPAAPPPETPSPAPRTAVPERATCPSCNTSTDPDARFCKNCGAKL